MIWRRSRQDQSRADRWLMLLAAALAGCSSLSDPARPTAITPVPAAPTDARGTEPLRPLGAPAPRAATPDQAAFVSHGTGTLVGPTPTPPPVEQVHAGPDGVTLDFSNAEIRDVARSVLGEQLRLNYVIDPQVQGQVTIQTSQPIPRASLLSALEGAFRAVGVALVQADGVWRVVPLANAVHAAPLRAGRGGPGYSSRIIPLHWVSALDIQRAIEPLLPTGTLLRADAARSILIVSGADQDVAEVADNVAVFDVDTLRAVSFALVPLRNARARAVVAELPKVLGTDTGPAAGMVRLVALDRLNAILVSSLQPAYVDRARAWIDRLDQGSGSVERRIYVYRVQNGRAADLATVLGKLLGTSSPATTTATPSGTAAEAAQPAGAAPADQPAEANGSAAEPARAAGNPLTSAAPDALQGPLPGQPAEAAGAASQTRITADETNNALLVLASPAEWATIEAALSQLDIAPLQVLIEASIAEVTLTRDLQYGLQYFFKSGRFGLNQIENAGGNLSSTFPGLNLLFAGGSGANAILDLLDQLTTVKVLSSPNLLVLNNQKARLQVGDQVPVATQSAVGVLTGTSPIVNSIEYRDTGVILQITPRVNASGLVLLDISQEVSAVAQTTSSSLDSPTIQQRRVTSSVAIQDGQTVALGGLISDNHNDQHVGIPVLKDLPYLGVLFGTHDISTTRTEIMILITPHVVRDRASASAVTEELRRSLPLLHAVPLPP
jgi:general secretion pathway protein D